jgi:hypothetical protein
MAGLVDSHPQILQHVLSLGSAAHVAREESEKLRAEPLDEKLHSGPVGLLILRHQSLQAGNRRVTNLDITSHRITPLSRSSV